MGESPFLLNGTIKEYLTNSKPCYPESAAHIEEIGEDLYVDDLITGDATIEEVQKVKKTAIRVFGDAKFKLHKGHSNVKELDDFRSATKPDISFGKQELRTKTLESKVLEVSWNKVKDTFGCPVSIISPITLLVKDMYRDACNLKLSWDQRLPEDLIK